MYTYGVSTTMTTKLHSSCCINYKFQKLPPPLTIPRFWFNGGIKIFGKTLSTPLYKTNNKSQNPIAQVANYFLAK